MIFMGTFQKVKNSPSFCLATILVALSLFCSPKRQAQAVARDLKAAAVEELSAAADASGVVLWHSSSFRLEGPGFVG